MRIQYTSDLHLEMQCNVGHLWSYPLRPVGDVLILAGDITKYHKSYLSNDMFDYFSDNWKHTIMIPGNHEYYNNTDLTAIEREANIDELIRPNVRLVNNKSIQIDDVNFICTTLWSQIKPDQAFQISRGMNDFYVIRDTEGVMTVIKYNKMHATALAFLKDALHKNKSKKTVVVTHHGPTQLINALEFVGSSTNSGFITELQDIITDNDIDYWIYGHTHRNIDAELHGTKIVSNQFGYAQYSEYHHWKDDKRFEL